MQKLKSNDYLEKLSNLLLLFYQKICDFIDKLPETFVFRYEPLKNPYKDTTNVLTGFV